jgi:hypothetical protein
MQAQIRTAALILDIGFDYILYECMYMQDPAW